MKLKLRAGQEKAAAQRAAINRFGAAIISMMATLWNSSSAYFDAFLSANLDVKLAHISR